MRMPTSIRGGFHTRAHPTKRGGALHGHSGHGFSRPMTVERLEQRIALDATPTAGPIPASTPAESVAGNPAFLAIAGGDETNQSLAQTSFIAGGPAAGIGPAGAGGSGGIGGGIVESGFTGTEFSPFNLPPGAFGGVHEGVIGEGPESTGNPSNDTRGAGPGAISNPAGSQMEWPGFNPYAVAETQNFGPGGRFGPDTGYPAPLPDDALLPRLFPRMTTPSRPPLGAQSSLPAAEGTLLAEVAQLGEPGWESPASAPSAMEPSPRFASEDVSNGAMNPDRGDIALDDIVLNVPSDRGAGRFGPWDSQADAVEMPTALASTDRAQRADRVMAGLAWQTADEREAEAVEAGTSMQASMMSAALVTVVFNKSRLGDHFWRAAAEPRQPRKRFGR